jgi:hypothetical protein
VEPRSPGEREATLDGGERVLRLEHPARLVGKTLPQSSRRLLSGGDLSAATGAERDRQERHERALMGARAHGETLGWRPTEGTKTTCWYSRDASEGTDGNTATPASRKTPKYRLGSH